MRLERLKGGEAAMTRHPLCSALSARSLTAGTFALAVCIFLPSADAFTGILYSSEVGWQEFGSGNEAMPEDVYGMRFDDTWGLTTLTEFDGFSVPAWGDAYARNGIAGGLGLSSAWEADFTQNDLDPEDRAQNGPIPNHTRGTNTLTPEIPEPSSMILIGMGLAGFFVARRRRK